MHAQRINNTHSRSQPLGEAALSDYKWLLVRDVTRVTWSVGPHSVIFALPDIW